MYRVGNERLESSTAESDVGALLSGKLRLVEDGKLKTCTPMIKKSSKAGKRAA